MTLRGVLAGAALVAAAFVSGAASASLYESRERANLESLASSLATIAHRESVAGGSARRFVDGLRQRMEGRFTLTGYTATDDCPGPWCDGFTATMSRPTQGRTVACPKRLAFGSLVLVDGVGPLVCEDRGGKIKGRRLDVFFDKRDDALAFGLKPGVPVVVLN